jgi:hypothetical protein
MQTGLARDLPPRSDRAIGKMSVEIVDRLLSVTRTDSINLPEVSARIKGSNLTVSPPEGALCSLEW